MRILKSVVGVAVVGLFLATGTAVGQANSAEVEQEGQKNEATVDQIGEDLRAEVKQAGLKNQATVQLGTTGGSSPSTGSEAVIEQMGRLNTATVAETGGMDNFGGIWQKGVKNDALIEQPKPSKAPPTGSSAEIYQEGRRNQANIQQSVKTSGDRARQNQKGRFNTVKSRQISQSGGKIRQRQEGRRNWASAVQSQADDSRAKQRQEGRQNRADSQQPNADRSTVIQKQRGVGLNTLVKQRSARDSWGKTVQEGRANNAEIQQGKNAPPGGLGANGVMGAIFQSGLLNEGLILQSGHGHSAEIMQSGQRNTATVTQRDTP